MRRSVALALLVLGGCQSIAGIEDLPGPPSAGPGPFSQDGGGAPVAAPPSGLDIDGGARCPPQCGLDGGADCCDAPLVPGGTFFRNYDAVDFTQSSQRATVSPFRLDRFEVTLGRFRAFVAAYSVGWRPTNGSGNNPSDPNDSGWRADWTGQLPADGLDLEANLECHTEFQTYRRTFGATEGRPINCVTWYVAQAFCVWDGGRLPSDAEWNFAAAGGDEQRYYPWNDVIDETRSSFFIDSQRQCFGDLVSGCAVSDLTAVGTHVAGAAKWGHMDMSGNVAEWTHDGNWGGGGGGGGGGWGGGGSGGGGSGPTRVVRGGAFNSQAPGPLRVAASSNADPGTPSETIGFRCARSP